MSTLTEKAVTTPTELEPDNAARLMIFDAVHEALAEGADALTVDELFNRMGVPLRNLVPREVHNHPGGARGYLEDKVATCVEANILARVGDDRYTLAPRPEVWLRYPDDTIQPYPAGLTPARERLTKVNTALRNTGFDVTDHLPHLERSSPAFQALVRSMREHGFIKERAVFRYADDTYIDGVSRLRAAKEAKVEPKWMKFTAQDPEARMRRRDTPLDRLLRALALNATRISEDERLYVLDQAAAAAGRSWAEIEADLDLTYQWRTAFGRSYTPTFEVTLIPFDAGGDSIVVVTADHKFHMTRLLSALGLQGHKIGEVQPHMAFEEAKYPGGGPAGNFAGAIQLIDGLQAMLAERQEHKRKIDPKWETLLEWLQEYTRKHRISSTQS